MVIDGRRQIGKARVKVTKCLKEQIGRWYFSMMAVEGWSFATQFSTKLAIYVEFAATSTPETQTSRFYSKKRRLRTQLQK
jgi:hypothetical protein